MDRWNGVVAQLVERLVRNEKVAGSIPVGSTIPLFGIPHLLRPGRFRRFAQTQPSGQEFSHVNHIHEGIGPESVCSIYVAHFVRRR